MAAYFLLQFLLFTVVMISAGAAAGLQFFRRNTFGVQAIFYVLYGAVQVAFAFLLSCVFSRTRTANITTWIWILGAGVFAQQLMSNMILESRWYTGLVQLIPTFGAYRSALLQPPSPLCAWPPWFRGPTVLVKRSTSRGVPL